jgi:hypothetical protein
MVRCFCDRHAHYVPLSQSLAWKQRVAPLFNEDVKNIVVHCLCLLYLVGYIIRGLDRA